MYSTPATGHIGTTDRNLKNLKATQLKETNVSLVRTNGTSPWGAGARCEEETHPPSYLYSMYHSMAWSSM